jgi:hypothetical protein
MAPKRKRTGYRPPRNRRDILVAAASALAVLLATGGLIWLFAPDEDGGSNEPVTPSIDSQTVPPNASTTPTTTPSVPPPESAPTPSSTP